MDDLLEAHDHTSNNRAEIEASSVCGCFHCVRVFHPSEIVAWSGLDTTSFDNLDEANAATALCPKCGSESVIGDRSGHAINPNFLNRMHQAWVQRTIIRKPSPKK